MFLDENLEWCLKYELPGHVVHSVPPIGWAGLNNSQLLMRAGGEYGVLITMDTYLPSQYELGRYRIGVVILKAPGNRLADTRHLSAGPGFIDTV